MKARKKNLGDRVKGERRYALKNLKFLTVLGAAVLLAGAIGLAACPPGTIDLSVALPGGGNIVTAGTYCVPATGYAPGATVNVTVPNVTIVGEMPSAIWTTGASPAINVQAGATNCTIHNFMIQAGGAHTAITVNADDCVIEGMRFLGTAAVFGNPVINLAGGQNTIIQNNEFDVSAGNYAGVSLIRLAGGQGAKILDNTVQGQLAATAPAFFVENSVAGYNSALIKGNQINGGVLQFVAPTAAQSFTNSEISNNTAICWGNGINLGATSTNTVVKGNDITYGADNTGPGGAAYNGIMDAGGANNQYIGNTIIASSQGTDTDDGIEFLSTNALIQGNTIDARGSGSGTANGCNGDAIDATADGAGGASNAQILDNVILGTASAAVVAPINGGYGIRMDNAANSNFVVTGNDIRNCAAAGIGAVAANAAPPPPFVGGTNHLIANNKISHTGVALTESAPGGAPGNGFPFGTAIATNGNCTIEDNDISYVRAGVGIATTGTNDQITGNTIRYLSDPYGSGIVVWLTAGNTVIDGNTIQQVSGAHADGIAIAGQNCQITNNTIDTVTGQDGIKLYDSRFIAVNGGATNPDNQTIIGNTIRNISNGVGINLTDCDNNVVQNNTIDTTGREGILSYACRGFSMTFGVGGLLAGTTASNNEIRDNEITGAGRLAADVAGAAPVRGQRYAAIALIGNADNNTVDGNTIVDAGSSAGAASYGVGIAVTTEAAADIPDNNDITNNTISGFTTVDPNATYSGGIRVLNGQNNTVVGNKISNSGNMQYGIDVRTVNELPITDNEVEGMLKAGLWLWGGTVANPLEVKGNTLTDNATGIWMAAGSAVITDCNKVWGGNTALYVDPAANAANFELHGNSIKCCTLAKNDGIGTLDATGNYWEGCAGAPPQAGVNIFGNVDFSGALASDPCAPAGASHTYGAVAGWYMVSLPAPGAAADFGVTLYRWDPATQNYLIATTVEPGKGYWANLPASTTVTATGTVPTSDIVVDISTAGWHQISAPWIYPKSEIRVIKGAEEKTWADAVAAGWVRDTIYGYTAVDGNYTTPTTLNPWYGYWVEAKVAGLSLKFLAAEGTPVTSGMLAPMGLPALATPAGLPPFPVEGMALGASLDVGAYPNPVTDVHTTTFRVVGPMAGLVEEIVVKIFDLSGRLVWEGSAAGAELEWHTESLTGEYLANGVYLYQVQVRVLGEWLATGLNKVAIYR